MKKKIIKVTFAVLLYIVSCFYAHKGLTYLYATKWTHINPSAIDLVVVFCPGINTGLGMIYILDQVNANNFFGIPVRK